MLQVLAGACVAAFFWSIVTTVVLFATRGE